MFRLLSYLVLLILLLGAGVYWFNRSQETPEIQASVSVPEAMAGDTAGYARAAEPRQFRFPQDHGPHPGYKTEWWYFTGNLDGGDDRHFGFQLTFFRTALSAAPLRMESGWAANQLYMGHFALTDVANGRYYHFERFSRGAMGLAGAESPPFRVWLEDWAVRAAGQGNDKIPLMKLEASENDVSLELILRATKPAVLQGDQGLSQKGPEKGNASFYYSVTRMEAEGVIRIGEIVHNVTGFAWLDREWSTSALGKNQVGWDWFSLQLSDKREVMYYQIRGRDGQPDRFSEGKIVAADGTTRSIRQEDVQLVVKEYWESPLGGRYPAGWLLSIPKQGLRLRITPYLKDQEFDAAVRYWEGAVKVEGLRGGQPVKGNGYVELTGYEEHLN